MKQSCWRPPHSHPPHTNTNTHIWTYLEPRSWVALQLVKQNLMRQRSWRPPPTPPQVDREPSRNIHNPYLTTTVELLKQSDAMQRLGLHCGGSGGVFLTCKNLGGGEGGKIWRFIPCLPFFFLSGDQLVHTSSTFVCVCPGSLHSG